MVCCPTGTTGWTYDIGGYGMCGVPTGQNTTFSYPQECTCSAARTGRSCSMCAENYTWNGQECVACPAGRTEPSGTASGAARSCSMCAENHIWDGYNCVSCAFTMVGTPSYKSYQGTAPSGPASGAPRTCTCIKDFGGTVLFSGPLCADKTCTIM